MGILNADPTYLLAYCERSASASFWAEPLNAVTNGWFVIAGLAGIVLLRRRPRIAHSFWHYMFVTILIAIGIGSFLFHTIPNGITVRMDTIPIGIFMLTYLAFAVRYWVRAPWLFVAAAVVIFIMSGALSLNIRCWGDGNVGFLEAPMVAKPCVNGSLGYGPALIVMWLIGGWLLIRRHPAWSLVLGASLVFVISVTFRSLDFALCDDFVVCGRKLGTHFIWHSLNATTLFLLLLASIRHGTYTGTVLPPKPKPSKASYAVS